MNKIADLIKALGTQPSAERQYPKGATLFSRGDRVSNFFVVKRGNIRMERTIVDGAGMTLFVAGPDQALAEASLFSSTYHCDGVAGETSEVFVYSKRHILDALRHNSEAAIVFMTYLAQQVQTLRTSIEINNIKSAGDRLLAYIKSQLPQGRQDLVLNGSWMTIASEVGLAHETVYRELARLEREGAFIRNGMHIAFVDGVRLKSGVN